METIDELKQQKESFYSLLQDVLFNTEYRFSDIQKDYLSHTIRKEMAWIDQRIQEQQFNNRQQGI